MEEFCGSEVSDGFTIIPAKFSEESLNANGLKLIVMGDRVKMSDLKDKIIIATQWHLELLNNASQDSHSSKITAISIVIDKFEPCLDRCLSQNQIANATV